MLLMVVTEERYEATKAMATGRSVREAPRPMPMECALIIEDVVCRARVRVTTIVRMICFVR